MKLEDYHAIDPIPSSKVTRAGPIEHCSPLICHIPQPTTPCPYRSSKQTGSPFSESSSELPLLLLLAKKNWMTWPKPSWNSLITVRNKYVGFATNISSFAETLLLVWIHTWYNSSPSSAPYLFLSLTCVQVQLIHFVLLATHCPVKCFHCFFII